MPKCSHQGCGAQFDESTERVEGECTYHSGGPVFHEGLKSWSCCKETNKPVMEFDEFVKIPGCTKGTHSATAAAPSVAPSPNATAPAFASMAISENGVETYGTPSASKAASGTTTPAAAAASAPVKPALPEKVDWAAREDKDPADVKVPKGSKCKRRGCGAEWEGEDGGVRGETEGWKKSQSGQGEECGECRYHPGGPIFHEGSKGYLCCKRRVLDFDDFLNMPGCRYTTHLFVGQPKAESDEEEKVDCRLDHYQTPTQVIVSAFAKGADKENSTVKFEAERVHLDLYLPARKRVVKTIDLYGPIDPEKSVYKILGTKVEMVLQKPSPTSWPLLIKPAGGAALPAGYALTFGVSGRTGTVGGKDIVVEEGKRL
ncbi:hypothetical protein NliqN6_2912 [Naganishia liquefaciens]|uniref:Uncharacterized protein n=1 Tax=Naganishia liquefaciens TaxID=104408 RepID=A0A8H3TSP6_9TREE|nr:hypothetical protein NliqN6_2912 [Naganishia liquefaciens]